MEIGSLLLRLIELMPSVVGFVVPVILLLIVWWGLGVQPRGTVKARVTNGSVFLPQRRGWEADIAAFTLPATKIGRDHRQDLLAVRLQRHLAHPTRKMYVRTCVSQDLALGP
jgi:hypothetical protein